MTETDVESPEELKKNWSDQPFTRAFGSPTQRTPDHRSARALEYIAHQLWHIRRSLNAIETGESRTDDSEADQS